MMRSGRPDRLCARRRELNRPYSQVILCTGSEAIKSCRAHTDTPGQLDGRDGRLLDLRATSPEVVATGRLVPGVSIRNERGRPKAPSSR